VLTHLQSQVDKLKFESKELKDTVDVMIDELGEAPWKRVVKDIIGLPRYTQLGMDAGALLRQGFDVLFISPSAWVRGARGGARAAFTNVEEAARVERAFYDDPSVKLAINEAGLSIGKPEGFIKEGAVTRIANKASFGLYGRGERFHKTFQNIARYEAYNNLIRGQNLTVQQKRDVANLINAMTGQGQWLKGDKALDIFTAPKMYLGNLEVMARSTGLVGREALLTNKVYRKMIARRTLGRIGGLVTLYNLAALSPDWEFSLNPDDSDFLQLRNGKTVIDPTGGYRTYYKLIFSTLVDMSDGMKSPKIKDKIETILENKISPSVALPFNIIIGEKFGHEPYFRDKQGRVNLTNPKDYADTFAPLIAMQMYDMFGGDKDMAAMSGWSKLGLGGLGFTGVGTQSYAYKAPKRKFSSTYLSKLYKAASGIPGVKEGGIQPR
jgi:hypothetical protein